MYGYGGGVERAMRVWTQKEDILCKAADVLVLSGIYVCETIVWMDVSGISFLASRSPVSTNAGPLCSRPEWTGP